MPYDDGYCNMLDTEEARYCADPGLIEEERQFEVDQNKLFELQDLCDRYSGEMSYSEDVGGTYKDTKCILEGYSIPLENAFEFRDEIGKLGYRKLSMYLVI